MSRAMAGTRRAYVKCAGCGHSRVRHVERGTGRCSDQTWVEFLARFPGIEAHWAPCKCPAFTEPKEK